jgi:teichuronic acid exporter
MRNTAASAFWVAVENGAAAAAGLGTVIVMARLLDPLQFAAGAIALSFPQILNPLAGGFFNDVILQRQSLDERHLASASIAAAGLGVSLWVALWLLAAVLGRLVSLPEVATLLPWISFLLVGNALAGVPASFARRCGRYRFLAIRTLVSQVTGAVLGAGAAVFGLGAWSIVVQNLVTTFIGTALVLIGAPLALRPRLFSLRALRELLGYALRSLSDILIWPAQARITTPLVSALMGPAQAAVWNVAFRIVETLYVVTLSGVNNLTVPLLARLQSDRQALCAGFATSTTLASLLVLPVFTAIAVSAPQLVRVSVGSVWLSAASLVTILSIAVCLMFIRHFVYVALAAIGRPGGNMRVAGQSSLAALVGLGVGAPFGPVAAAIGFSLRVLPHYLLGARLMREATGLSLRQQLAPAIRPVVAVIAMAAAMLAARYVLEDASFGAAGILAGSFAAGLAGYAAAVLVVARRHLSVILFEIGFRSGFAKAALGASDDVDRRPAETGRVWCGRQTSSADSAAARCDRSTRAEPLPQPSLNQIAEPVRDQKDRMKQ